MSHTQFVIRYVKKYLTVFSFKLDVAPRCLVCAPKESVDSLDNNAILYYMSYRFTNSESIFIPSHKAADKLLSCLGPFTPLYNLRQEQVGKHCSPSLEMILSLYLCLMIDQDFLM